MGGSSAHRLTISTILVLIWWQDAKYGLIPNVLIFLGAMISLNVSHFEAAYRSDVSNHSTHMHTAQDEELLTQEDLDHLPLVVQRYIEYTGFVGQPKVRDAYVIFNGEMHNRGADWFSFTSEQRNFFEFPGRYFFMKAIYKGLPTHGYHRYELTQASMKVKVLSTIPVVNLERGQLDKAETVTFLNDMCILAPGALIDDRITWREIDKSTVVATYTNDTIVVSAQLEFDDSNRLINFISDDRMDISDNTFRRFSTPISSYKTFGKYTIGSYGEAVWHYDDGPFVYGKFKLQNIRYNAGIDHIVK